ncbi:hypothetical protein AAIB41_02665 [Brucella sp. BE17]|uniref:hypothetical protein n=1 Tax=Brucella sp. BE17 TaxID=3142977 RepID=UPI0031BAF3C3
MKIPMPESERDVFGDEIIRPVVSSNDGFEMVVDNFDVWAAYTKEFERKRDAAMLERGEISQADLRKKNGMLSRRVLAKARIVV